jgi:methionine-rich copper-binding protein CopC
MKNFNYIKLFFLSFFTLFLNANIANAATVTFSYTGAQQTFTVPNGVTSITVDGYGAGGGDSSGNSGGNGARVQTTLTVTPGDILYIYVGETGWDAAHGSTPSTSFNGGGKGGQSNIGTQSGGSGGGQTDIRTSTSTSDIIMVAAGGGGASAAGNGGSGGQTGSDGVGSSKGLGASQSSGGTKGTGNTGRDSSDGSAFTGGTGGRTANYRNQYGGGGGGAGYYGGGGGGAGTSGTASGSGGGGSSYVSSSLGSSTTYTAGYSSASGNGSLEITYTDATNPTLSSSTPADNATAVGVNANIVLNFDESVDVETGNITIKKTSDNSIFETISVTSSNVTGTGTTQITVNPSSDFDYGTEYYVLIDTTAFDDSSSNSYAGISSTTALSFTTLDPTTDKDVVGSIDVQSQLAKSSITQFTSTVSSRLNYLRQNRGNDNLSKNNIKLDFGNAILSSLTNELLAKNDKSIIPDNWSSWSEGSISVSKTGDSLGSSSSETDAQALALGFDTKLNDSDLLGFAIQYGKSDTDVGSSGTNVESENINLSVYRTRPLNDDNFIEGMFGVGLIESDLVRVSGSNTLTGSRSGTQIFGSINYGKTLDKGDFNLTPIARVDLGYTELDAYSETGTDALSYTKQSIESGLASLGLEFSDIVKFNDNKLKPFGSIEYGMDFSNSSDVKMNYVSDTGTIFTYTQGANSNHLITSVVGFEYITKDNLNIISSYKRIQGNESEQTDILNVSVNFKSKRETEYAMSVDGSEDLKAGFDITKNVNGFDLNFNANQSLSKNSDQTANVSLSRSF